MPLYRCMVAAGTTNLEQRELISKEVTRIHCDVTGAPAKFVHTFFADDTDGKLPEGKRAFILGSIRTGRTAEQKDRLTSDMQRSVASILGVGEAELGIATVDVPARWVMEGGAILPEPGEETAWLEKHG